MAVEFDVLLGKLRVKDIIPELEADPTTPSPQAAWVLRTGGATVGEAIGLLLSLTYGAEIAGSYTFKYRTKEGTTVTSALT
jgi:hypothetical protein